ncbi:hypothetical protein FNV43_RR11144 [Rhamnella rubrinervis]|uniref:Uncharacterized protein n=1 Tax=Rhamnella rubrinervis TaxID=2594499 RepID=A0A8K0H510_9ROSA|nr:hypothetical protein FNV43_RR11144 [Rhamnella rubrinervis]
MRGDGSTTVETSEDPYKGESSRHIDKSGYFGKVRVMQRHSWNGWHMIINFECDWRGRIEEETLGMNLEYVVRVMVVELEYNPEKGLEGMCVLGDVLDKVEAQWMKVVDKNDGELVIMVRRRGKCVILVVKLGEIWDNYKVEVLYLMELATAAVVAADRHDGDQMAEVASGRHIGVGFVLAAVIIGPQGSMEMVVRVVESSKGKSFLNNIDHLKL